MEKLREVLAMGGYATYVWPSFLLASLIMCIMAVISVTSLRQVRKSLALAEKSASALEP